MKNWNALLNDTDEELAEDTGKDRVRKSRRKASQLASHGNTTGCRKIIADNGKLNIFVKPNQDVNERLEHYRFRYPDAKIAK
jgi:hypothetical protein